MSKKSDRAARARVPVLSPVPFATGTATPSDPAIYVPHTGGRLTIDSSFMQFGTVPVILPPSDFEFGWKLMDFSSIELERLSPTRLIEIMANISPEISRAIWDFLRQLNSGWTATALRPGPNRDVDLRAQAALDDFLLELRNRHGSVDVVLNRIFMSTYLRGAMFTELVLDEEGRTPLDLATPDPASVRFRRMYDPVLGAVWTPGQWQWMASAVEGGSIPGFVAFERETISYIPLDPFPGNPYGRSPVTAAIFSAIFLLGLLHDLRRVVQQQGWPRLDIGIDLEKTRKNMPPEVATSPQKWRKWLDDTIADVQSVFANLKPDQAYVHTDNILMNRPAGTVDASSLGSVGDIIQALERMLSRALKTLPLFMGIAEGTAESQSNRQAEAHYQSIRILQHGVEEMLERQFELALQALGVPALVEFRFAENRASEELRDQQTLQLKLANAKMAYDQGLVDQDEQAKMALGLDKADQPEPRVASGPPPSTTAASAAQPEPGINRQTISAADLLVRARALVADLERTLPVRRDAVTPTGASDPLPAVPTEVPVDDDLANRTARAWDKALPDYAGLLRAEVVTS